jgi:hypothetical protein
MLMSLSRAVDEIHRRARLYCLKHYACSIAVAVRARLGSAKSTTLSLARA